MERARGNCRAATRSHGPDEDIDRWQFHQAQRPVPPELLVHTHPVEASEAFRGLRSLGRGSDVSSAWRHKQFRVRRADGCPCRTLSHRHRHHRQARGLRPSDPPPLLRNIVPLTDFVLTREAYQRSKPHEPRTKPLLPNQPKCPVQPNRFKVRFGFNRKLMAGRTIQLPRWASRSDALAIEDSQRGLRAAVAAGTGLRI